MIVEVIDPVLDPHIIEYKKRKLILLDIILNQIKPAYLTYPLLTYRALQFNMECKKHVMTVTDWQEVEQLKWLCEHPAYFDESGKPFEGYVFRDAKGLMFKMKTAYYLKWKKRRWQADRIVHDLPIQPEQDPFLLWVEQNKSALAAKSLIEMRNLYEKKDDCIKKSPDYERCQYFDEQYVVDHSATKSSMSGEMLYRKECRCNKTKEQKMCHCNGNDAKCDFYPSEGSEQESK